MKNFVAIIVGVFAPEIRDFDVLQEVTIFKRFLGFLQIATAYTPERISTKNTSKTVVPAKDVPFGRTGDYI